MDLTRSFKTCNPSQCRYPNPRKTGSKSSESWDFCAFLKDTQSSHSECWALMDSVGFPELKRGNCICMGTLELKLSDEGSAHITALSRVLHHYCLTKVRAEMSKDSGKNNLMGLEFKMPGTHTGLHIGYVHKENLIIHRQAKGSHLIVRSMPHNE